MGRRLHPDAEFRKLVDAMVDHAVRHDIKLRLRMRWPNGMGAEVQTAGPARTQKGSETK